MKWNIGSSSASAPLPADHPPVPVGNGAAKCPIDHASLPKPVAKPSPPAQCPVDHKALAAAAKPKSTGATCPIDHNAPGAAAAFAAGGGTGLNPANNIPNLSATEKAPGQQMDLGTERTLSTIPRPKGSDDSEVWEYPSEQQFYNALVRKGWETPEDSMEVIVEIHNFINERGWDEIMKWEKRHPGGEHATLARFQGRPGDISPKARLNLMLGKIFPSTFNTTPPFDRHDWIVTRPILDEAGKPTKSEVEQRYVIDYYTAGQDEDGMPVFSLDVRPAVDSFGAATDRIKVAVQEWMGQ